MIPLAEPAFAGNELSYLTECIRSGYVSSVGRFRWPLRAGPRGCDRPTIGRGLRQRHVCNPRRIAARRSRPGAVGRGPRLHLCCFGQRGRLHGSGRSAGRQRARYLEHEHCGLARRGGTPVRHGPPYPGHHRGGPSPRPAGRRGAVDRELRDSFGTRIVEDAAESLGTSWTAGELADRHVGTVGDYGCFSFNGNKIITTGGGGMLVTRDPAMATRARHLTTQARSSTARATLRRGGLQVPAQQSRGGPRARPTRAASPHSACQTGDRRPLRRMVAIRIDRAAAKKWLWLFVMLAVLGSP